MSKSSKSIANYRFDDSVGYLIARARLKLTKEFDDALTEHDITKAQGGILLILAAGRCETAAELARELYTDSASMTRMIDRLEKRGLVKRVRRADDRRVVNLHLTDQGQELAERLPKIFSTILAASFAHFNAAELDALRGLLRKFLDSGKHAEDTEHLNEKQ
jgi:DNA-binding MarR family transcriptional regulator